MLIFLVIITCWALWFSFLKSPRVLEIPPWVFQELTGEMVCWLEFKTNKQTHTHSGVGEGGTTKGDMSIMMKAGSVILRPLLLCLIEIFH